MKVKIFLNISRYSNALGEQIRMADSRRNQPALRFSTRRGLSMIWCYQATRCARCFIFATSLSNQFLVQLGTLQIAMASTALGRARDRMQLSTAICDRALKLVHKKGHNQVPKPFKFDWMASWVSSSFCIVELSLYHMLNEIDGKLVPFYNTAIPQFHEVVAGESFFGVSKIWVSIVWSLPFFVAVGCSSSIPE